MKRVNTTGMFDTSRGKIFVISEIMDISVGEEISINEKIYTVKNILFPTVPTADNKFAIVV